ncbi:MAG: hypothetical protein CSA62_08000 [Planctomycetota bacterium]|nr:MAG: hypothetical protein CSA62_08000 [Planctomycetota bacterium]
MIYPLLATWLDMLPAWTKEALIWLGVLSVATVVFSALALPWVVLRLPEDYFRSPAAAVDPAPGARAKRLLRNIGGAICILLGIAMLVLPGQGILTILIGLTLMDFPGKQRLERGLVRRGRLLKPLNWIRSRAKKTPLLPPE